MNHDNFGFGVKSKPRLSADRSIPCSHVQLTAPPGWKQAIRRSNQPLRRGVVLTSVDRETSLYRNSTLLTNFSIIPVCKCASLTTAIILFIAVLAMNV